MIYFELVLFLGNWAGISRGVCGSQLHKPTVPDFVTGAQLSPEITSRRIDYASPVETRAICEQRGDVHSCMYFRKHELGTPSCNHPRACDPKVFNDASQTIVSASQFCSFCTFCECSFNRSLFKNLQVYI